MDKIGPSELRNKFLKFFEAREHTIVPSSSLLPADPTSLFTSAGMQQFVPYLSGEAEPPYKRACSVQKCLRVGDIDEVGDASHHTFFEMLGNWSFGDYLKKEAIGWALEFLVDVCQIPKDKLWASVFKGEGGIPQDKEAIKLWRKKGFSRKKIFEFGMQDNFWGPVTKTGPCGPCSEIFYDLTGIPCERGKDCVPNCQCGRFVEIWNLVFMEYNKKIDGSYEKMQKQNVDTGSGFERLLSVLQNKPSGYETELFWPIIEIIEQISGQRYEENKKAFRVISEHLRASLFIIAEGVLPSNLDRGYVLRRLLRRTIRYARKIGLSGYWHGPVIEKIAEIYGNEYPEVRKKKEEAVRVIQKEKERFEKVLQKAELRLRKILIVKEGKSDIVPGFVKFEFVATHGLPSKMFDEIVQDMGLKVNKDTEKRFNEMMAEHRELSRQGVEKKFGGIGIDQIEDKEERKKATRLHTATHLLHQALREVLGEHVQQLGSDITPERLRFDFSHPQKLIEEEIRQVEDLVNKRISQELVVTKKEMSYEEAIKSGALAFFKEKYPREVFVYSIQDKEGNVFSQEVCAGPHVETTVGMGRFKIIRQESAGAGVRRIKAILE